MAVPFLWDLEVHIRFLVAMPLLIIAEFVIERQIRPMLQEFLNRNLIPEGAIGQFDAAITSAFQLRNSVLAEALIVAFVYGVGIMVVWRQYVVLDVATWYGTTLNGTSSLSLAGMWVGYISLPIFQFLLVRWYFRLFVWTRMLWQFSRIKLHVIPTHPDLNGGLSFVSHTTKAYSMLAAAHGALLAGFLATRIIVGGRALIDYKTEVALMTAFVLVITLGPLVVFAPQLAAAKRVGLREYGRLSSVYVGRFDEKWLRSGQAAGETFIGSPDIQSLSDIGGGYERVQKMRPVPVKAETALRMVYATILPILPLFLTMLSLQELIKKLVSILMG